MTLIFFLRIQSVIDFLNLDVHAVESGSFLCIVVTILLLKHLLILRNVDCLARDQLFRILLRRLRFLSRRCLPC